MQQEYIGLLIVSLLKIVDGQGEDKFVTDCMTPNNENGLCIEIQGCKTLLREVEQNNTSSFDFIRASRCGPANEDISRPRVCCGPHSNYKKTDDDSKIDDIIIMPTSRPAPTIRTTTTPLPGPNYEVLPKMCGKQKIFLSNRIFGGSESDVGEFPWLARLVHINIYNRTRLGCSGFLIHRRFVLTAAHCLKGEGVKNLGELQSVILGMHNDTKARICSDKGCTDAPLFVKTQKPIIHEEYDSDSHTHDIALIPLSEKIVFTEFIRAICLLNVTTNAQSLTISGWGRTETDASSRTKMKVDLPMVDRLVCAEKYKSLGLPISNMQLCAGGVEGHDSCSGDSGGPLMAVGADMRWYAEGIVSFGNSCGREDWPGVYTNIPTYYNWITTHIRNMNKIKFRFG